MSDQLNADALRLCVAFRASLADTDTAEELAAAIQRAGVFDGPKGHQADAAERAGAYRQFAQARERLYGRVPEGEGLRNSLSPDSASPMVRRLFGG